MARLILLGLLAGATAALAGTLIWDLWRRPQDAWVAGWYLFGGLLGALGGWVWKGQDRGLR